MTFIRCRLLLLAISTAAASACGGNASISPTAPSRTGNGASGAVIIGQVTGASQPGTIRDTSGTFRALATSSIIVKITGTSISTTTDGQGQFTLTGVPPGDVQLEFSGQGTNAKIVITGVGAQDQITISVTLNGNNAHVDSEHRGGRDDRGKDQNEVSGVVSGLPATKTCPTLAFMVKDTKVTTTASTVFAGVTCANLSNGAKVEVTGPRGADGSIAATRVEFDD